MTGEERGERRRERDMRGERRKEGGIRGVRGNVMGTGQVSVIHLTYMPIYKSYFAHIHTLQVWVTSTPTPRSTRPLQRSTGKPTLVPEAWPSSSPHTYAVLSVSTWG